MMSLDIYLDAEDLDGNSILVDSWNITHNLTKMAYEAGIYYAMWRPDKKGWTHARDIVDVLDAGVKLLATEPTRFREFDPPNGWGSYEGLLEVASAYLEACRRHPSATIRVWR